MPIKRAPGEQYKTFPLPNDKYVGENSKANWLDTIPAFGPRLTPYVEMRRRIRHAGVQPSQNFVDYGATPNDPRMLLGRMRTLNDQARDVVDVGQDNASRLGLTPALMDAFTDVVGNGLRFGFGSNALSVRPAQYDSGELLARADPIERQPIDPDVAVMDARHVRRRYGQWPYVQRNPETAAHPPYAGTLDNQYRSWGNWVRANNNRGPDLMSQWRQRQQAIQSLRGAVLDHLHSTYDRGPLPPGMAGP